VGIALWYLVRQPPLSIRVKALLALGLGVLPLAVAGGSTALGMSETMNRRFCGSCHVMQRHTWNAEQPSSMSLAARHTRNPFFGGQNCYICHADYGMYGYPLTKLNGMKHVWSYYLHGFRDMPLERAIDEIQLFKPYQNVNCKQCHSGTLEHFKAIADHASLDKELAANAVSCTSGGCHGFAHPFSKFGKKAPKPGEVAPRPSASARTEEP
jgi:cytochrome c-type protein NapC